MTVSKMICGSKVNTLLCFPFSGLYPGGLKHRYTGLGAQTSCPKNHKWHRTSYAKCAYSIIAFRVLKNHPLNVLKIVPQNAGNGISETLNFKIFRGACPRPPQRVLVPSALERRHKLAANRCAQIISGYGTDFLPMHLNRKSAQLIATCKHKLTYDPNRLNFIDPLLIPA